MNLYNWHVTMNYSDLLYITYKLSFLVRSEVSTRRNSSFRRKICVISQYRSAGSQKLSRRW